MWEVGKGEKKCPLREQQAPEGGTTALRPLTALSRAPMATDNSRCSCWMPGIKDSFYQEKLVFAMVKVLSLKYEENATNPVLLQPILDVAFPRGGMDAAS